MKELSIQQTNEISGGVGFTFLLSMIAGATGVSRFDTAMMDGLWWGTIGFIAGLPLMGVGALITGPLAFTGGAIEGFVGHAIGSIFYNPPQPTVVYVQAATA